jgi:sigma-B regulation protein RsbU (phosphoserine phosphatase)
VFSVIVKPWNPEHLKNELTKAVELYDLRESKKKYISIIEEELKWGGELQKALLDRGIPDSDKLTFSVLYEPLPDLNCGGDYYDVFEMDPDRYVVLIGDVCGHGIKAAFITVILKTIIYSGYVGTHREGEFSTSDFFYWLNNEICKISKKVPDIIISFLVCSINLKSMKITCSNAGHLPFFKIYNDNLSKIYTPGTAMGFKKNVCYEENIINIESGDKLIMYTDGLVEIGNISIEKGENIIRKVLLTSFGSDKYNQKIYDGVLNESGRKHFTDDVSVISVDIH